jgi:hypothetical protein
MVKVSTSSWARFAVTALFSVSSSVLAAPVSLAASTLPRAACQLVSNRFNLAIRAGDIGTSGGGAGIAAASAPRPRPPRAPRAAPLA